MKGPAWLYEVAKDSALNARDICAMLGISSSHFNKRIARGEFPEADFRLTFSRQSVAVRANRREWYVRTVIQYFRSLPE